MSFAILPIKVLSPTLVTTIFASPSNIVVEEKTSSLLTFFFPLVSPLIEDSFTSKKPSIILPSATILSPLDKIIISPLTTSLLSISFIFFSLSTFTLILFVVFSKFSNDLSLPYSDTAEIIDEDTIAISIPMVSK